MERAADDPSKRQIMIMGVRHMDSEIPGKSAFALEGSGETAGVRVLID